MVMIRDSISRVVPVVGFQEEQKQLVEGAFDSARVERRTPNGSVHQDTQEREISA